RQAIQVEGDFHILAIRVSFDVAASLLLAARGLAGGKELVADSLFIDLAAIELIAHELDQLKRAAQEPLVDRFGTNHVIQQELQLLRVNSDRKQWSYELLARQNIVNGKPSWVFVPKVSDFHG